MKTKLSILFLLFFIQFAKAQQVYTVSGKVIEKGTKLPLPGVSILIKGTKLGTTTDQSGNFNLKLNNAQETLTFSFLGFASQDVSATAGANLNVALTDALNELDEVVVVAYGTAKRRDITGSVSRINGDQLQNRQVSNITKALQGLAPGIQAVAASGQPGTSATIRIRGIGSLNASSAPLYVVDGNPFSGDLSSINPNDIESISVLKDAASSALYGSRGANGVIIITTKTGKKNGDTQINASFSQGVSKRGVKDYEQVTTDQYFENYWLAAKNKQRVSNPSFTEEQLGRAASAQLLTDLGISSDRGTNPYGPNYPNPVGLDGKIVPGAKPLWDNDWGDATQQTAMRTQADLSFNGGSEKTQYYIAGGYLNDKGIALASGYKRYNARVNLTTQAKKWLTAGLNISAANSKQDYPTSEDSNTANVIQYSRAIPSFYSIYERNIDGSFKLDGNGNKVPDFGAYRPASAIPRSNLPATVGLDKSEILKDNVSARTFLEATIIPGLKLKTTYSGDYTNSNSHNFSNPLLGDGAQTKGEVSKSNSRTYSWTWNNILTYENTFKEDHHLNLLAGQEIYKYNYRVISGSRQRFVLPGYYEPDAAAQLTGFSGNSIDYTLIGFFGRAEYDYKKRYLFSASLRSDGTSRFSPEQRWGTFWSLGASWKISEEDFLKETPWLSTLTLRSSYGAQGNDNIGTYYAYKGLYAIRSNLGESGLVTSRLETPDLKWESNLNLNIGLDFGLFNDRISGTIEYFDRRSKDLLFSRPKAPSLGFSSIDMNIGDLKNTGIEIQLNAVPVRTTDFRWTIGLNATHYKNTITSLPQAKIETTTKSMRVGGSSSDFFLKEWAGVNPDNGEPQWYMNDANGNKVITNDYSKATQYIQGSSLPDLVGGVSNTFNYKDFELSALFTYSLGGKILDGDYTGLMHAGSSAGRPWSTEILTHWTPENRNTNVPRLITDDAGWTQSSTRFLYSGTYARLKNLTVGYNLPKAIASRWGLYNLKLTLTGENLLTFYGHKGMDPEQTIEGTTYFRYPSMKTFSAGLNLTF